LNETLDTLREVPGKLLAALSTLRGILSRRTAMLLILLAVVLVLVGLPLFAQTKAYPVAVVDGNSMVPTLHNGDLVFFTAPKGPIKNGTIIVFIQSDTAVTALDSLLKPIVIHRIISVGQEPNGHTSYQTKGDNNQAADPFVTDQENVLGTPVLIVPYLGLPVLFFKTTYGMFTIFALVSLYFFSGVDTRFAEEEQRKRLVAVFAQHSLNGEISASQFERLNKAVEYGDEMSPEEVRDPLTLSVINWLNAGGLDEDWREEPARCPNCSSSSFRVVGGDADILVCPSCEGVLREKSEIEVSTGEPIEISHYPLSAPETPIEPRRTSVQEPAVPQKETWKETLLKAADRRAREESELFLERQRIGRERSRKDEREFDESDER
jgi:signal peptidase I